MLLATPAKNLFFTHHRTLSKLLLPPNFASLKKQPDPERVNALTLYAESKAAEMQKNYPDILHMKLAGKIAYSLRPVSPQLMLDEGGFQSNEKIWVSNITPSHPYCGENKGSICFSLLPEVATIFTSHHQKRTRLYLYAIPLVSKVFLPGGPWRQVICPGAIPIPPCWLARELLEIGPNREVKLGPLVGHVGSMQSLSLGERYNTFISNTIVQPPVLGGGGDSPIEFHIVDTPFTKNIQALVEKNHTNTMRSLLPGSGTSCSIT